MGNIFNQVRLIGNVGSADFDNLKLKQFPNGKLVTNFTLATHDVSIAEDGKKTEYTEWHDLTAWNKVAQSIATHVKSGAWMVIEGHLKTRKWVDEATKQNRKATEIVVDTWRFVGAKKNDTKNAHAGTAATTSGPQIVDPATLTATPPPPETVITPGATTQIPVGHVLARNPNGSYAIVPAPPNNAPVVLSAGDSNVKAQTF